MTVSVEGWCRRRGRCATTIIAPHGAGPVCFDRGQAEGPAPPEKRDAMLTFGLPRTAGTRRLNLGPGVSPMPLSEIKKPDAEPLPLIFLEIFSLRFLPERSGQVARPPGRRCPLR